MEARLRPLSVPGEQECHDYAIGIEPEVSVFTYEQPGQMGTVNHFVVRGDPHTTLTIHAESTVETLNSKPFAGLDLLALDWESRLEASVAMDKCLPLPGAGESSRPPVIRKKKCHGIRKWSIEKRFSFR